MLGTARTKPSHRGRNLQLGPQHHRNRTPRPPRGPTSYRHKRGRRSEISKLYSAFGAASVSAEHGQPALPRASRRIAGSFGSDLQVNSRRTYRARPALALNISTVRDAPEFQRHTTQYCQDGKAGLFFWNFVTATKQMRASSLEVVLQFVSANRCGCWTTTNLLCKVTPSPLQHGETGGRMNCICPSSEHREALVIVLALIEESVSESSLPTSEQPS